MTPLAPAYLAVLRSVTGLTALLTLLPPSIAGAVFLGDRTATIAIAAAAVVIWLAAVLILPRRRYAAWSYLADEDELHVQRGIWFRARTVVPYGRVQHIDVSQGPFERRKGVATLTLHTAGTLSSSVSLPGLLHADAERMRDEIRGKIRLDLA